MSAPLTASFQPSFVLFPRWLSMPHRYTGSLGLLFGLYFSSILAGFELGQNPGLETKCFKDDHCDEEPPSCLLTSGWDEAIKDCYPGSTPGSPAKSFLTVSQDYDWKGCIVSIYSDDSCKTNKTTAPVGKCMRSINLGSYGFDCPNPVSSSSARIIVPTQTISSSKSATASPSRSAEPASQPSSKSQSDDGNNNGGLSTTGTIALGVVIPAVSVIVAIIFGIRMWNSGFPLRKRENSTEIPTSDLGDSNSIPPSDSMQSWKEMPGVSSKPAELNEPWMSRTTTAYSEVPGHSAPLYPPFSGGYANIPPDDSVAISPISSMNSYAPYNISQAYRPGHDGTPMVNSQFPFSQSRGTNWGGSGGGQPPTVSVAELPTESRRTAHNIPELPSHDRNV